MTVRNRVNEMTEPTDAKKTSQAYLILHFMRGQPPMTVEQIKRGMDRTTQTTSARCSDLEAFGLLEADPNGVIVRGNHVSPAKVYRLTVQAEALLAREDGRDILRAANAIMTDMNKQRAIEFARAKREWRRDIACRTRENVSECLSRPDKGT
jgi:predicted ArsR family transcriptional regulator